LSVLLLAVILGVSGPAPGFTAPVRAGGAPALALAAPAAPARTAPAHAPHASGHPAEPPHPVSATEPPAEAPDPATARIFAQARVHFDAGTDHYAAGRYEEAIRSFQAGYSLVPRPSFLVNIGQAYRKLGNLVRAKEAYVAYVRALPENSAIRDQALQVLAEIEVQLHDGKEPALRTELAPRMEADAPAAAPVLVSPPPSRTAAWVGLGIGGAGLALFATGLGFEMRAKAASDNLAEASKRGDPFDPSEERAGKRAERIGNGLFAAGGVVMAAGLLIFLVLDTSLGGSSASAGPHVAVAPDRVGLGWRF
jgi:tetratricopeptide (TPR) repeat protein